MKQTFKKPNKGADASPKASQEVAEATNMEIVDNNTQISEAGASGSGEKETPSQITPTPTGTKLQKPRFRPPLYTQSGINEQQLSAELIQLSLSNEKKRLSGAGKRRYAYHRNKGKSIKEAYDLACLPMRDTLTPEQTKKRQRPPSATPPSVRTEVKRHKPSQTQSVKHRPAAEAQPSTSGTSYRDAIKGTRIGIIHAEHPHKTLTPEQLAVCQKSILAAIPTAAKEGTNPQFGGLSLKPGWMLIICLDDKTSKWLEQVAALIKVDESTTIKAVKEEHIPKLEIVTGYFPAEEDPTEVIITLIASQNPKLCTENWKVLSRRKEGTCTVITFSIDGQSMENLKQLGNRVCYKFSGITLRPKSREVNSGKPPTTSDVPESKK